MKALRIIAGAVGTFAFLPICILYAAEWMFYEAPIPGTAIIIVSVFGLIAFVGVTALFMSATLSEGQYTKGNRRYLLGSLTLGGLIPLFAMIHMLWIRQYLFGSVALLATGCIAIVAWCIYQKKNQNA